MVRTATLHDVARKVGVSARTVSRVVNGESNVAEPTRERVLAAVEELGYRPNPMARALITQRSGMIGLVAADKTDPFFTELAEGVQRAAEEYGLTMLFASSRGDRDRQRSLLAMMRSHAVDGVLLFPVPGSTQDVHEAAASGLCLVAIDEDLEGSNITSVSSDIRGGAEVAVGYLQERGCKRIAMVASDLKLRRAREAGYASALTEGAPVLIERAEPISKGGIRAMERLLERAPDIDGVFAYNDLMALGAIRSLIGHGKRVPEDVAVIGFDNIAVSGVVMPALSTISVDRERLGRTAVEHLTALRDVTEGTLESTILPVELVVREST